MRDESARASSLSADAPPALPAALTPWPWTRSSFCGGHGACVETAELPEGRGIAVRDGKIPHTSPVLVFQPDEWAAFVAGVKNGEFG